MQAMDDCVVDWRAAARAEAYAMPLGHIDPVHDELFRNGTIEFYFERLSATDTISLNGEARYTRSVNNLVGCTAERGAGDGEATFGQLWNLFRSFQGLPANPPIPIGGRETANAQFVPALIYDEMDEDNVSWRAGAEWKKAPSSAKETSASDRRLTIGKAGPTKCSSALLPSPVNQ